MLYFIVVLTFCMVFLLFYGIFYKLTAGRVTIEERMDYVENMDKRWVEGRKQTFAERTVIPTFNAIGDFFLKLRPTDKVNAEIKRLEMAGILKYMTPERWFVDKWLLIISLTALTGIIMFSRAFNLIQIFLTMLLMVAGLQILIRFYTATLITNRKKNMWRDLPYTLDLITVSVEAGLSLDGAISKIVNNIEGPLTDEFGKTLKEMRMGVEKRQALKNMSDRCELRPLSVLVSSLIQAEDLGVGLGKVLRIQGEQLREERRQNAREQAMKAPIKLLFPLVFFIFPVIYIILLGPAVIQVIETFVN